MMTWVALGISLTVLLTTAQRNLYFAMFASAGILGLLTLSVGDLVHQVLVTFSDPSIVSLSFVVAIIAMVGGVLEESGEMDNLVKNMRIGKRPFLASSPALLGMLPMPGGALLSAPMIEQSAQELRGKTKAALNIWFRHILFLVYPLGPALIASAKIAGLEVYQVIPYLFPFFILSLLLGYYFFLRETEKKMEYDSLFSFRGLFLPLLIILAAPIIDLVIKITVNPTVGEYATLIGVLVSFGGATLVARYNFSQLWNVGISMKPWNFALIVLGMFTFLNVFKASGAPEAIGALNIPMIVLLVVIAFLLGLITGRIQAPASILVPVYLARVGVEVMPVWAFTLGFFSIFLGYVVSPIHPCVSISVEYFDSSIKQYLKKMLLPTVISLLSVAVVALFVL